MSCRDCTTRDLRDHYAMADDSQPPKLDDLNIGDMVQLRVGGPVMLVSELNADSADCRWFSALDVLQEAAFRPASLRLVSKAVG